MRTKIEKFWEKYWWMVWVVIILIAVFASTVSCSSSNGIYNSKTGLIKDGKTVHRKKTKGNNNNSHLAKYPNACYKK